MPCMCGIAGYLTTAEADRPIATLEAMLAPLAVRGPDAQGVWRAEHVALGHRRLSILDLSDAANQPMRRGDLTVIHNGEIYNFVELREELVGRGHTFSTTSDTEVVLAAYSEWGRDCVDHFRGMFAFAIWDAVAQRLFCARDRMGEKPFFYFANEQVLAFASEIKSVLRFGAPVPCEPDLARIDEFMRASWQAQSSSSFFRGVRELLPAHTLEACVDGGRVRVETRRYWAFPERDPGASPLSADDVRAMFDESTRMRLRSDVPIGTSLSGGVDSPSVVGAVKALAPGDVEQFRFVGIHAFAPVQGCDEREYVSLLADHLSVDVEYVEISGEGLAEDLDELIYRQDEPFLGPSIYAQRCVFRRAEELGLKVMLDGQGADELFGGYDWAVPKAINAVWSEDGSKAALACARAFDSQRFPRAQLAKQVLAGRIRRSNAGLPDDFYDALHASLCALSLPSLLRYADRNSMSFGIEARLPFLDHVLIEATARLRAQDCIAGGDTKAVLRDAMRSRLPARILDRTDKTAFAVPEIGWMQGALRDSVRAAAEHSLWSDLAGGAGHCRRALAELVGAPYARVSWKVLCVSRWFDRFFGS